MFELVILLVFEDFTTPAPRPITHQYLYFSTIEACEAEADRWFLHLNGEVGNAAAELPATAGDARWEPYHAYCHHLDQPTA